MNYCIELTAYTVQQNWNIKTHNNSSLANLGLCIFLLFFFPKHILTFEIIEAGLETTTFPYMLRKRSGAFCLVKCNPDLLIGKFINSHFVHLNAVCGCIKNSEKVLCLKVVCFSSASVQFEFLVFLWIVPPNLICSTGANIFWALFS